MDSKIRWTLVLTLLMPLFMIIAVFMAGGGHGWYGPAFLLFPWASLPMVLSKNPESLQFLLISLAFLQWPLYGFLLDLTKETTRFKNTVLSLVLSHIFFFVLTLFYVKEPFN
ncbi:hypothetical protein [Rufibacter tibetensis]|uniref:Uncharacterized protein n=1 Tax=Rufibacter tibetensis TaxID=512763 RepID=A0A0P0C222_9BACT|nr:hypothetical protein [Rufibacter tibetensis]ALI98983.1 hypothetical protein DC20_08355 [Rufibacter tibetensis]